VKLSVVIPAHNEAGSIEATLKPLAATLESKGIDYELLVVDDASMEGTTPACMTSGTPGCAGVPLPA
jgi:glycosyltransferase involved in cell wall biosynthesis